MRQNIEDKVDAAGYDTNSIITFENIVNAASSQVNMMDIMVSTWTVLLMHATSCIFILLCYYPL